MLMAPIPISRDVLLDLQLRQLAPQFQDQNLPGCLVSLWPVLVHLPAQAVQGATTRVPTTRAAILLCDSLPGTCSTVTTSKNFLTTANVTILTHTLSQQAACVTQLMAKGHHVSYFSPSFAVYWSLDL